MGNCFNKKDKGGVLTEDFKEFYCPNCEEKPSEIVEILRIHPDSGKIDLLCPKKEKKHFLNLKDYIQESGKSNNNKNFKCTRSNCSTNQNENQENSIYCPKCRSFLCRDCIDKDNIDNLKRYQEKIEEIQKKNKCGFWCFWRLSCVNGNKHPDECIHIHIKQNDLSITCLNHGLKTDQYCQECEKYVCKKCSEKYHCRHDIKNISIMKKDVEKAKEIINKNKKTLENMIEFLTLVQNSYENNLNNDICRKNIVNVAECIKNEEKRDNYDIDLALYKIRQTKKNKLKRINLIIN